MLIGMIMPIDEMVTRRHIEKKKKSSHAWIETLIFLYPVLNVRVTDAKCSLVVFSQLATQICMHIQTSHQTIILRHS